MADEQAFDDRHGETCKARRKSDPVNALGCILSKGHSGKCKDINGKMYTVPRSER